MEKRVKEKHIIKIDKLCQKCGYRNKYSATFDVDMNIVACGHCGNILSIPDGTNKKEIEVIKGIINTTIKENK